MNPGTQRVYNVRPVERITHVEYTNLLRFNSGVPLPVRGEIGYEEGESRPPPQLDLELENDVSADNIPSTILSSTIHGQSKLSLPQNLQQRPVSEEDTPQTGGLIQSTGIHLERGETPEEENVRLKKELSCELKSCTSVKNAMFIPCGHNLFCMSCAGRPMDCPKCGKEIEQVQEVIRTGLVAQLPPPHKNV